MKGDGFKTLIDPLPSFSSAGRAASKNLIEKDCDEPSNHWLDKVELLEGAKGGEGLEHVADLVAHTTHLLLSVTCSFFVL